MANYLSKYSGEQIDQNIGILEGKGLSSVDGLIKRASSGAFSKVVKKDITDLGIPGLDSAGKIPISQLPSYVDDVIEGYFYNNKFYEEAAHTTEITAESGKIYIDIPSSKSYRWSGSQYVVIASSLNLGETDSTAYRGDRGKYAYDFAYGANAQPTANKGVKYSSTSTLASSDMDNDEIDSFLTGLSSGIGFLDVGQENADLMAAVLTQNVTLASGWTGTVKYDKVGDLVIVYLNIQASEAVTSNKRIDAAAIETSYRPSKEEKEYVRNLAKVQVSVNSTGQITLLLNGENVPLNTVIRTEVAYYI